MSRRMSEERHTNSGKCSQPGVPHKGWSSVENEDFEERPQFCEMCKVVGIRYALFYVAPRPPQDLER